MDSSVINIGLVPKYVGIHESGKLYKKYNIVTKFGSSFICVDENTNDPVTLHFDDNDRLIGYELNSGWEFFANTLDSCIMTLNSRTYLIDSLKNTPYGVHLE